MTDLAPLPASARRAAIVSGYFNPLHIGHLDMMEAARGPMEIASLAEDALSAVPQALRQGSFAMGANRMQTTLRVVFPAALSGIAAAIVLGMSRAIGETMIVALAAGAQKNLSLDPREGMQTMTGFIAQTAQGENPVGSVDYNMLFAVGLTLFVMTMVINMISISLVRRFRQEY